MTRNQFLAEKVLKEHWHKGVTYPDGNISLYKCSCMGGHQSIEPLDKLNPHYDTPEGFFKLWDFCKKQEWWNAFVLDYYSKHWQGQSKLFRDAAGFYVKVVMHTCLGMVNPDKFADAVAKFRGWEEE